MSRVTTLLLILSIVPLYRWVSDYTTNRQILNKPNDVRTPQEREIIKDYFIAANPGSLAAIKVNDPDQYDTIIAEGNAYSDAKADSFNSLTDEQKGNYQGGF